ncbi:GTP cyclohydrolase-2 [Streptomyces alboniger]
MRAGASACSPNCGRWRCRRRAWTPWRRTWHSDCRWRRFRDYGVAAEILHDLGVNSVRLMSNNPRKREALVRHGIQVAETVPLLIPPCENNITYLRTKRERLDHQPAPSGRGRQLLLNPGPGGGRPVSPRRPPCPRCASHPGRAAERVRATVLAGSMGERGTRGGDEGNTQ